MLPNLYTLHGAWNWNTLYTIYTKWWEQVIRILMHQDFEFSCRNLVFFSTMNFKDGNFIFLKVVKQQKSCIVIFLLIQLGVVIEKVNTAWFSHTQLSFLYLIQNRKKILHGNMKSTNLVSNIENNLKNKMLLYSSASRT